MLQSSRLENSQLGQDPIQRICFPNRDEIQGVSKEIQDSRSAYHICQQAIRHIEDELRHLRRGSLRGNLPEAEEHLLQK